MHALAMPRIETMFLLSPHFLRPRMRTEKRPQPPQKEAES